MKEIRHPYHPISSIAVLLALLAIIASGLFLTPGNTHAQVVSVRKDIFADKIGSTFTPLGKFAPKVKFACQSPTFFFRCFGPQDFYKAYNIEPLLKNGITGKGRTIVIIDANQAPTIANDLHVFDVLFGLPDPTLNIFTPEGTPLPSTDATETTLDVELAHAIAPHATIDLVLAKSLSNADILGAIAFVVANNLGDDVSQSFGENELADPAFVQATHQLFVQASAKHITLLASSGDTGASVIDPNTGQPVRGVSYPASDPLVTAVGGTALYVDAKGQYVTETAWNDSSFSLPDVNGQDNTASGGGFSAVFSRPSYQNGVSGIGNSRGVPDVAYDASGIHSPAIIVCSSCGGGPNMIGFVGGTSAGSPQWAGIVALADQLAGKRLGFFNPRIYTIGKGSDYSENLHDIRTGNNTFSFQAPNGQPGLVIGFSTQRGWDPVTGFGSPIVANLVKDLVNTN